MPSVFYNNEQKDITSIKLYSSATARDEAHTIEMVPEPTAEETIISNVTNKDVSNLAKIKISIPYQPHWYPIGNEKCRYDTLDNAFTSRNSSVYDVSELDYIVVDIPLALSTITIEDNKLHIEDAGTAKEDIVETDIPLTDIEPALAGGNIVSGKTIFGVPGTGTTAREIIAYDGSITPSESEQTFNAPAGKAWSSMSIAPIPSNYVIESGTYPSTITDEGTYDVKQYAKVNIDVTAEESAMSLIVNSHPESIPVGIINNVAATAADGYNITLKFPDGYENDVTSSCVLNAGENDALINVSYKGYSTSFEVERTEVIVKRKKILQNTVSDTETYYQFDRTNKTLTIGNMGTGIYIFPIQMPPYGANIGTAAIKYLVYYYNDTLDNGSLAGHKSLAYYVIGDIKSTNETYARDNVTFYPVGAQTTFDDSETVGKSSITFDYSNATFNSISALSVAGSADSDFSGDDVTLLGTIRNPIYIPYEYFEDYLADNVTFRVADPKSTYDSLNVKIDGDDNSIYTPYVYVLRKTSTWAHAHGGILVKTKNKNNMDIMMKVEPNINGSAMGDTTLRINANFAPNDIGSTSNIGEDGYSTLTFVAHKNTGDTVAPASAYKFDINEIFAN